MRFPERWIVVCLASTQWLVPSPAGAQQETIDTYFKGKCAICHYIGGGKLIGPDLKELSHTLQAKGRPWVVSFIRNPKELVASDDYARKMWEDYNKVDMIVPGPPIDETWAEALVDFILKESDRKEGSTFAKGGSDPFKMHLTTNGQFREELVTEGQAYFVGAKPFTKGGPSCVSCHAVGGASSIGGGLLGPDLTHVLNKLKGREGLYNWLFSPPTATMQPIYKNHQLSDHERVALVAYLEKARAEATPEPPARLNFFLLGLIGTVGALALFDYIWRWRFRGVRKVLVNGQP